VAVHALDGGAALAAGKAFEGARGHRLAAIGTATRTSDPRSRDAVGELMGENLG
jgi:hypothetical protein